MKFWTVFCAAAVSTLAMLSMANADVNVGVQQILAPSKERGTDLDVTVWYPAQAGGEEVLLGDNRFFAGTTASRNAPIIDGKHPVILLSHGTGGHAPALGWIAAPLAKAGYIVAAPNHPGSTGEDLSAAETFKMWLRPADLTATLDAIENASSLKDHIDTNRVGAVGFSLGGSTVFAIAGGRMNPLLLASYCDTSSRNPYMCGWVKQSGVDLHAMNLELAGRNNIDARVHAIVAVDPGPSDVFTRESIASISISVDIISLGRPEGSLPTLDASEIARTVKGARHDRIERAVHESMVAECKAGASEALKREKLPPLCDDGDGNSRSAIHAQLIDMITDAFDRTLKAQ